MSTAVIANQKKSIRKGFDDAGAAIQAATEDKKRGRIVKKGGGSGARSGVAPTPIFSSNEEVKGAPRGPRGGGGGGGAGAAAASPRGGGGGGGGGGGAVASYKVGSAAAAVAAAGKKAAAAAASSSGGTKKRLNLVVAGHVDAGKSTMMGRLLHEMNFVGDREMAKFERDSATAGKGSFKYAWVLDETAEERARGVTVDVGRTYFETEAALFTLLDAPGHRDFIPNMIAGAAQADCGVMVVNTAKGEFETWMGKGGQTREHAVLLRAAGVNDLVVACNKMDAHGWDKARYEAVVAQLVDCLRKVGYQVGRPPMTSSRSDRGAAQR